MAAQNIESAIANSHFRGTKVFQDVSEPVMGFGAESSSGKMLEGLVAKRDNGVLYFKVRAIHALILGCCSISEECHDFEIGQYVLNGKKTFEICEMIAGKGISLGLTSWSKLMLEIHQKLKEDVQFPIELVAGDFLQLANIDWAAGDDVPWVRIPCGVLGEEGTLEPLAQLYAVGLAPYQIVDRRKMGDWFKDGQCLAADTDLEPTWSAEDKAEALAGVLRQSTWPVELKVYRPSVNRSQFSSELRQRKTFTFGGTPSSEQKVLVDRVHMEAFTWTSQLVQSERTTLGVQLALLAKALNVQLVQGAVTFFVLQQIEAQMGRYANVIEGMVQNPSLVDKVAAFGEHLRAVGSIVSSGTAPSGGQSDTGRVATDAAEKVLEAAALPQVCNLLNQAVGQESQLRTLQIVMEAVAQGKAMVLRRLFHMQRSIVTHVRGAEILVNSRVQLPQSVAEACRNVLGSHLLRTHQAMGFRVPESVMKAFDGVFGTSKKQNGATVFTEQFFSGILTTIKDYHSVLGLPAVDGRLTEATTWNFVTALGSAVLERMGYREMNGSTPHERSLAHFCGSITELKKFMPHEDVGRWERILQDLMSQASQEASEAVKIWLSLPPDSNEPLFFLLKNSPVQQQVLQFYVANQEVFQRRALVHSWSPSLMTAPVPTVTTPNKKQKTTSGGGGRGTTQKQPQQQPQQQPPVSQGQQQQQLQRLTNFGLDRRIR